MARRRATSLVKGQPEQIIKRHIITYLKYSGCFCWVNSSVGIFDAKRGIYRTNRGVGALNGVADILGIWKGVPLAIEVKGPKGRVSPEQEDFLNRFRMNGGIAFVARSIDDVIMGLQTKGDKNDNGTRNSLS